MGSQRDRKAGRPSQRALSVERIADCAIALADEEGLEALSMRRLGERLGVEAMSLYHYLPSKGALLDAIVGRLGRALPMPPAAPWREALGLAASSWRELARRHPGVFPLLATRATAEPALVERSAILVERLQAAGFTPAASARALSSFLCSLNGFLLAAGTPTLFRDVPEPELEEYGFDVTGAVLAGIPPDAWVLTSDAAFEFHVALLLDGLQAALERELQTRSS